MSNCYHCAEAVPKNSHFHLTIDGQQHDFCCPGCQAIAQAISDGGLDQYYKMRTELPDRAKAQNNQISQRLQQELALFDDPVMQQDFVVHQNDTAQATLVIEGITCAACIWLLEQHLKNDPSVSQFSINHSNHRAQLIWNAEETPLSELLSVIYRTGYRAYPFSPDKQDDLLQAEYKQATRRLTVAGIGMMQVMMFAIPLYQGTYSGMSENTQLFLRFVSLFIATPVVLYSAQPFFIAAIRDIKSRQLTMDVPVSIAIGGAYFASLWAVFTHGDEVYFDSVCMFTFFLLLGRFLEMRARHQTGRAGNQLASLIPTSATKLSDGQETLIPAKQLCIGDFIIVKPGESIPADGEIISGESAVDESALTGEYMPVKHIIGDQLIGGSRNVDNPLTLKVTAIGAHSKISTIVRLLDRANEEKPAIALIADTISGYFVAAVLLTATLVGGYWFITDPSQAFWITLSVLVVTCPCALSLATPTAMTAATGALRSNGLLITRGHVLEGLNQITTVVFDKTGTLTEGKLAITDQITLEGTAQNALEIASALEKHSTHPIAHAFDAPIEHQASSISVTAGQGIQGLIGMTTYRIGVASYVAQLSQCPTPTPPDNKQHWILLGTHSQYIAWFSLSDRLRNSALHTIQTMQKQGLSVEILSGDRSPVVNQLAKELGVNHVTAGASPQDKLDHLHKRQQSGHYILMIGDGINDVPVLAGAPVSIAMGKATDLAKTTADAILTSSQLSHLIDALAHSKKTRGVIKQNITWALMYNACALPLAAMGLVPPWAAAIGMSLSSLIVVGNALRLTKVNTYK